MGDAYFSLYLSSTDMDKRYLQKAKKYYQEAEIFSLSWFGDE